MPRSGSRFAKDSGNHTTGCYGTNPLEAMPAVYIYDSNVKDKAKLKLKAGWVKGLPVATGQWGFGREHTVDAHVCVRKGGGMEEELFIATVLFYISLYPNIRPTFEYDGTTLLFGPIFLKIDSGNGRQTKSKPNLQFRYDMHKKGVYIGPGLPNSTAATQEMDDLYEDFKAKCNIMAQEVFTMKTYNRAMAVQRLEEAEDAGENTEAAIRMIKPAQLDNFDIPEIVDGKPGYELKKRPWSYCFTPAKIFKCWMNIGFVPFTRQALTHKKVRHMLGDGGASDKIQESMRDTEKTYKKLKIAVQEYGVNSFVFNSKLPVHKHRALITTEDEQVKALLAGKSAFSAGGQWCTMGFALLGCNAILRAQKEQIKIEAQGNEVQRVKDKNKATAKLEKAQASLDKFTSNERMLGADWKAIIAYVLPRYKAAEKLAACQTIPKIQAKLKELENEKGTTWALFMAEELLKSRANLQPATETMENSVAVAHDEDLENLDDVGDPSLYGPTMAA
jgi:hypothetical protein